MPTTLPISTENYDFDLKLKFSRTLFFDTSSQNDRKKSKIILAQRRGSTIVPVAENEEMILTDAQYQAFQEAFELFDKNGGGTIDAAELQKTLDDCGIYVNGDDLGKITHKL